MTGGSREGFWDFPRTSKALLLEDSCYLIFPIQNPGEGVSKLKDCYHDSPLIETKTWWATTLQTVHEALVTSLCGDEVLYVLMRCTKESLLKPCCTEHKDNETVGLATQTELNSKWYPSLGFELVGETVLPEATNYFPTLS
ncbi:hypothetical protein C8J56DRAFT_899054 [Mycena floridula]|nr:hypothetical protein C8J56DRAFT_899054 [Mycena floridula]